MKEEFIRCDLITHISNNNKISNMRHILILFSSSDVISLPFLPFLPYNRGIGLRDSFISIFNFNHHKIHKRPAARPQFVYRTKINSEIIIIIIIYYYCSLDVISHSSPSSPSPPATTTITTIHTLAFIHR